MAKRPRRFKKASITFPIDLYAKVAAAVEAAPPHSMSSWVVEACRAALPKANDAIMCGFDGPEVVERREPSPLTAVYATPEFKAEFHRECFALVSPRLTDSEVLAVEDAIATKAAASVIEKLPAEVAAPYPYLQLEWSGVPMVYPVELPELPPAEEQMTELLDSFDEPNEVDYEAQSAREFGPQVLSAAARSVPGWGKWDWKQRLEHLRELKAAAVST